MPLTADNVRGADYLDSRDLIELHEELTGEDREANDDEREIIDAIGGLEDSGIEEWEDGAQLIREDYFEQYAREFAQDVGAIEDDDAWPHSCIDWAQASRELAVDYTLVSFLGHWYYVR